MTLYIIVPWSMVIDVIVNIAINISWKRYKY